MRWLCIHAQWVRDEGLLVSFLEDKLAGSFHRALSFFILNINTILNSDFILGDYESFDHPFIGLERNQGAYRVLLLSYLILENLNSSKFAAYL